MYAIVTIEIETATWEPVPMPGCPAIAIGERIEMLRMCTEKGGGSIRIVETVIKEKK